MSSTVQVNFGVFVTHDYFTGLWLVQAEGQLVATALRRDDALAMAHNWLQVRADCARIVGYVGGR